MRRLAVLVRLVITAVAMAAVVACGAGISGTWHDSAAMTTYRFERDGRATVSVLEARVTAEYVVAGDRVLVSSPQGTVVLKRQEGRLVGPMGQELIRQPE